eukprot:COSAG02_NODE_1197_length_13932_cov_42.811176_7_plen_99_part_00
MLYGSTSGAAVGKRSTDSLGGNSYEAEEYSYVLSGDPVAGCGGSGFEMNDLGGEDNGANVSFSGSRPLTACGKSSLYCDPRDLQWRHQLAAPSTSLPK